MNMKPTTASNYLSSSVGVEQKGREKKRRRDVIDTKAIPHDASDTWGVDDFLLWSVTNQRPSRTAFLWCDAT